MDRYESKLSDYFKKCKSYEHKSRSIDQSELPHICNEFKLSYKECSSFIKTDSNGRIILSELVAFIRNYPRGIPQYSHIHPMGNKLSPMYCYTDESYTSDPIEDDSHEVTYEGQPDDPDRVRRGDTHRNFTSTHYPKESPPAGTDYEIDRHTHCRNCKHWQKQANKLQEDYKNLYGYMENQQQDFNHYQRQWTKHSQEIQDLLSNADRENSKLQSFVDKLQNDLKQTAEHYKKLQKDKEKLGKEVKRLREEADSDSGQRHLDRHFEDSIKAKDEYETAIRQYKRHFDGAKQENTQLKQQNYEQQREIWQLRNELQRYQCDMVRNDSLSNGKHGAHGGSRHHSHSRTSTPEQEQEKPVRDKAKSVKSVQSEASDIMKHIPSYSSQSQTITILNEDVSTSILPDSLTQEQCQQIVYALQNCHSIQELVGCLISYSSTSSYVHQEAAVENDMLKNKVKHLEAKNQTLSSSFEMAKQETESMYVKLTKVEGNNMKLRTIAKMCQQACEVHELLYEMATNFSTLCEMTYPTRTGGGTRSSSDDSDKGMLSRARILLRDLDSNMELQSHVSQSSSGNLLSGWNLSMSQYTGTTSGLSSAASSMAEVELNSSEMDQLKLYYQGLVKYAGILIKNLEEIDGIKGLNAIKEPAIIKDSLFDSSNRTHYGICDMEDCADNEELCKIREEKAELRSQIYMMEQSKRSIELQASQNHLHKNILERAYKDYQILYKTERDKRRKIRDKLKQLKGDGHRSESSGELQLVMDHEKDALHRCEDLFVFLQKHIQESQETTDHLVEFIKELLKANRALVEAFEKAKKRQLHEKRQMKQEILQLTNRLHSSTNNHILQ